MNEKVKECIQCESVLPLDEFQFCTKSRDKRDSKCRACKNDYLNQWRFNKFKETPSKYLLLSSTANCYYRGQPLYTKPPYQDVTCEFESSSDFFDCLWNDNDWMKRWNDLTDKYIESGRKEDKPSINRINPKKGYFRDNIEPSRLGDNIKEGSSHPCQLFLIPNGNLQSTELLDFDSKQELRQHLIDKKIPINVMRTLDDGRIHELDCGLRFIVQTKNGTLKLRDKPLYEMVLNYQRYLIDYETGREFLLFEQDQSFITSGIRLNINKDLHTAK